MTSAGQSSRATAAASFGPGLTLQMIENEAVVSAALRMYCSNLVKTFKGVGNIAGAEWAVASLYLDVEMSIRICDFDVFVAFDDDARCAGPADGQQTGDAEEMLVEKTAMDSADPRSLYGIKGRGEF